MWVGGRWGCRVGGEVGGERWGGGVGRGKGKGRGRREKRWDIGVTERMDECRGQVWSMRFGVRLSCIARRLFGKIRMKPEKRGIH